MKPHKRSLPPDKPASTKVRTFEHSDPSESSGQQQSSGTATTSASSEQTGVPVPQQAGRRVTTTASNEQTSVPLSQQATNRVNMKPQKRSLPPEKSASTKVRTFEHDDTSDNRVQPQSSGTGTTTASNEETGVPVSQQASSSGTTMTPSQQTSDPVSRQTTGGVSAMTRVQQTSVTVSQQATSSMTKKSHKRSLSSEIYHSRKHRKCEHSKTPDSHVQEKATSSGKTTASNQHSGIPVSQQTTSIGTTMTPSQQTAVPVSQQATNSGTTMIPSQQTGAPASQQAINSGTTMTPSQQTVVPPSQQTTSSDITTTPSQQTAIPASQQATISGTMMTPSQKTVVSVSQQTTSSGTTMTPSQQTGDSLSQQATSSSATMTPSQQTGASVSQQTTSSGTTMTPSRQTSTSVSQQTTSNGTTMTPSQQTGAYVSQQATSNGTTMTPSQQTGGSVSQQATSRGITMTPSQQTGASVSQQASCSGPSQNQTTSTLQLTPDDENYWRMVKILLGDVPTKLRQHFRSAFQGKYRIAWGDNSTSGKFFMAMVPKSKKRDKHITDTVENGVTQQFDCTTLFYCLLFSGTDLLTPVARKKELRGSPFHQSERIHQLREQRNAVAHATEPSLSVGDFRARMQEIEDIYTELQWNQTELKKAAYDPLWPTEYGRLQKEIDVEKARVDQLEHQHQKLEQRVQQTEQQQEGIKQFVKNVEALRSAENEKTPGMNALQLTQNDTNFWHLKQILQEDVLEKLREVFKSAFQKKYRFAWSDNSTSGSFFMAQFPKSKKPDQHIRATLRLGTTDEFNCATLCYCLLDSGTELLRSHVRKKAVDQVHARSNSLDDATSTYVSDEDFNARLQELEHIYQEFQWDRTRLDAATQDRLSPPDCDRLKQEKFGKIVREKVKKALREAYINYTIPFRQSVDALSCRQVSFDDIYVELRLQKSGQIKLSETLSSGYRDLVQIQQTMQSHDPILMSELFAKLHDDDAPKQVLILGQAGIGKTSAVKQLAKKWAEKKLWTDEVEYLFVVTLRELRPERKLTLGDILLGGLGLTEEEMATALKQFRAESYRVMVVAEGMDEAPFFKPAEMSFERDYTKEVDLNTLLASIIDDTMLPWSKVLVTSRRNDNIPTDMFQRSVQLYGFSQTSIKEYIHKFCREDYDLEQYITRHLQNNVNIETMCYIPVNCNFVCVCLADMYSSTHNEDTLSVNTMTQLYIFATINLARNLHPSLKSNKAKIGSKEVFAKVGDSLKNNAELAKYCTLSTPLRIIVYEDDLDAYKLSGVDKHTGFLSEYETRDLIASGLQRKCWTFSHLSIQEMLAAVGLLRGPSKALEKLIRDKHFVRRNEVLMKFIAGLLCDPQNAHFMKCIGSPKDQLTPRTFVESLAGVYDTMQLTTVIHEGHLPSLVDLVPQEITLSQVFPTEMMSLSWVLKQPECHVTNLILMSSLDIHMLRQLCEGMAQNESIQQLELGGDFDGGPLATTEAGNSLGIALRTMGQLREIRLRGCGLTPESLSPVLDGLRRCQHLEVFTLEGDYGGEPLATTEAGTSLGTALRTMGQLREIRLWRCGLTPESLSPVLEGMTRCQHMEVFDLVDNKDCLRSTETTLTLGDCLRQQDQLRRLSLGYCGLTPASLSALSTALTGGCRGLKEFDCDGNDELGDNSDNTGDTLRGMLRHWHQLHIRAMSCFLSHSTVSRLTKEFGRRFSDGW